MSALTDRLRSYGGVPLIRASREAADMLAAIDALCERAFQGGLTRSGALIYAESIHRILHPKEET